jgi:hypothetical protein
MFFSSVQCLDRLAHPTAYLIGIRGPSPGVKRLGRDADQSPSSNTGGINGGDITSFPTTSH